MYKTIIKIFGITGLVKFMRNEEDNPEILDFYIIDPIEGDIKINLTQEANDEIVDLVIDNISAKEFELI